MVKKKEFTKNEITPKVEEIEDEEVVVANCVSVNIREKASKSSNVLFVVPAGERFFIVHESGTWTKIENEDSTKVGFIMSEFLEKVS